VPTGVPAAPLPALWPGRRTRRHGPGAPSLCAGGSLFEGGGNEAAATEFGRAPPERASLSCRKPPIVPRLRGSSFVSQTSLLGRRQLSDRYSDLRELFGWSASPSCDTFAAPKLELTKLPASGANSCFGLLRSRSVAPDREKQFVPPSVPGASRARASNEKLCACVREKGIAGTPAAFRAAQFSASKGLKAGH
jgi:hypothetical protein